MPEIGPTTRDENLERLARDSFDVCVIGGGITGAGVALDAASRGLSVALVERGDFASGTSSKSSKMIHGGLRYLANYEFGLTYEASRERDLLRRLAPHLVRPLRFLFPAYKKGAATRFATIGLTMYDAVAAGRGFERHHRARARDIVRLAPTLDPARVVAAWTYYDASTDDARLVFEVLRTAHGFGATIANHITVEGFERSGGRIAAAQVLDAVAGRPFVVRARSFVNAAGVWAGEVGSLDGENPLPPLRPAKGIHLVVPSERIPVNAGIVIPSVARDGRSMFAVPWGPNTVLGTTDTEYSGSLDAPSVDSRDVTYMLDAVNWSLGVNLGAGDVVSAWAGLRPLLAGEGGPDTPTADLSRKAHLSVSPAGLVNITGGKLTTYRRMAADAVDLVCSRLGVTASSRTRRIPIGLTRPLDGLLAETRALAERIGIDPAVAAHLVAAHGDRGPAVIELALEDRSLAEPLAPGLPWIGAEAVWAVRREMAIGLPDVLERRTRLSLADPNAGLESAAPGLVARGRGWTEEELAAQVARVGAVVSAERGVVPGPGPARVTRP
ncbi:MAG: glycerol-3-phosphate dehydrogenase/oxidase [Actinobacteria bacterium]|nr:MAG: glycerol-3-phosphate dehydrogenase/oxidase [Actinomycetota bacterium]